jgi:hypothetical protein
MEEDVQMTSTPLAIVAAALAAGLLAGCDLTGGATAPPVGTPAASASPTPDVASGVTPTPAAASYEVVPVIECPTTYGIPNPGPSGTGYPSTIALNVAPAVAEQLSAYSDDYRDLTPVLGPRGWSCSVSVGADGSTGVVVFPSTASTPAPESDSQIGPPLVSAHSDSACMGCIYQTVCPFVPDAAQQLGYQGWACSTSPPAQETVTFENGSPTTSADADIQDVIEFTDAPGISGDAGGSGGADAAQGVVLYDSFSGSGTVGQSTYASQESCALPASDQALCPVIIGDFVMRAWLMGEP